MLFSMYLEQISIFEMRTTMITNECLWIMGRLVVSKIKKIKLITKLKNNESHISIIDSYLKFDGWIVE